MGSKQRRRRINACDPYTMRREHAAEAALAQPTSRASPLAQEEPGLARGGAIINRSLYKGPAGMKRWVGLGVIADTLINIGVHLAARGG